MFLNFEEKKTLITSYFYSNFNYYSLVWVFSSAKSLNKVESLQKRAYFFFMKTMFCCMRRYCKNLCIEIFKLINNINLTYMNEIFKLREISRAVCSIHKRNLDVPTINKVSFGGKSLRYYRHKIWNSLSFHIKYSQNLEAFINIIKHWNGVFCKCKCTYFIKYWALQGNS